MTVAPAMVAQARTIDLGADFLFEDGTFWQL